MRLWRYESGIRPGALCVCMLSYCLASAPSQCFASPVPRLAFQVYAVRSLCEGDFVGTLKAAKALGVESVEPPRLNALVAHRLRGLQCAHKVLFAEVADGIHLKRKARRGN